jgi:predicted GIY-YIG superfamily endonuclease
MHAIIVNVVQSSKGKSAGRRVANLFLIHAAVSVTIASMIPAHKKKTGSSRWYLYLLRCRDGTLYTGITNDIKRRTAQHNRGVASHYTRSRLPVEIIYQERCRSRSSALRKEYAMKQLPRAAKVAYVEAKSPAERSGIMRKKDNRS